MELQPRLFDFAAHGDGAGAFIVSDSNRAAVALLEQWRAWPGGALALTGPAGAGKTRLARLWAGEAGAAWMSATASPSELLAAFEAHHRRLAFDPADAPRDDQALIALLDAARQEGGAVLLVGREPPERWRAGLGDLRSRFTALLAARLEEPDDYLRTELLRRLCRARFIELRENVAKYLSQNMERSYAALHALVDEVDKLMTAGSQPVPYDVAAEALARLARRGQGEPVSA
ncbi:MAG: DnaA/Hda family protein [Hyphomonadaceae bacterium]